MRQRGYLMTKGSLPTDSPIVHWLNTSILTSHTICSYLVHNMSTSQIALTVSISNAYKEMDVRMTFKCT